MVSAAFLRKRQLEPKMKQPKRIKPRLLYAIAAIVWAQAILLLLSGLIKPELGRWWQGLSFFILLGAIGALSFLAARRESARLHRQASGLCVKCGYDLRSTPDRCPECGTIKEKTPVRRTAASD